MSKSIELVHILQYDNEEDANRAALESLRDGFLVRCYGKWFIEVYEFH
jgi:hypothetical protein